jgi:hypothetical protein
MAPPIEGATLSSGAAQGGTVTDERVLRVVVGLLVYLEVSNDA